MFAIAHVRGSQYLGRSWYENGQLSFESIENNDDGVASIRDWYENGQLQSEKAFKNGELQ